MPGRCSFWNARVVPEANTEAVMRWLSLALLAVAAVFLGFVQVVSDVLARPAAQPASALNLLPAHVSGKLLLLPSQQLLAAREALADGNVALTQEAIAQLPPSPERFALEGGVAELRGDLHAAAQQYTAANDYESLERVVMQSDLKGEHAWALQLQRALLAQLRGDRTHLDAFAEAWFYLGRLEAEAGARDPQAAHEALADYEHARALAPFNQKYVLSEAFQALALHDLDRANALFSTSYDADPTSIQALVALGDIALARGHRRRALGYLLRAQHLNAAAPDVERLAQRLRE
jgi:tetratricopeptide (TPR) repeat protein